MAKYRYSAQVDCKRGNTITSKNLQFVADENAFKGTSVIKDLNKVALRFIKNQNGGEVVGYSKIEVRGYSKLGIAEYSNNKNKYKRESKRRLTSYNILLIPFVLLWRIFNSIIRLLDRFL